jgi:hypothetical protein
MEQIVTYRAVPPGITNFQGLPDTEYPAHIVATYHDATGRRHTVFVANFESTTGDNYENAKRIAEVLNRSNTPYILWWSK